MPKTSIVGDYQSLSALVGNQDIEVLGATILSNDNVIVTHKLRNDSDAGPGTTSPAIACFVTAWARLELYKLMQSVEAVRPNRICYCDTDSLIFIERNDDPPPSNVGNFLGQLTDEISPGLICKRAVFAGCKSYALELTGPNNTIEKIIKVKGLSLNSEAMQTINFESMRQMIESFVAGNQQSVSVPQTVFKPYGKADQRMTSHKFGKIFRVTSDKRFISNFETYPYGYKTEIAHE